MAAVAESQAAAEIVKAEVLQVKERAVALVSVIAAETAVAEDKLAAAKPALDAAEAALQVLFFLQGYGKIIIIKYNLTSSTAAYILLCHFPRLCALLLLFCILPP